jgi:cysteine synthase A
MPDAPPETGLDEVTEARFASLHNLIGNTPLVEVRCRVDGRTFDVYAKYEVQGFTGSIKDRMALHMLEVAWRRGEVATGDVLAEATSGNTGISFAAVGRALDHPVRIYMPNWMSRERVHLIQSLGAEIVPVTKEEGGFLGSIALADAYAAEHDHVFRPQQFENDANIEAHATTTGPELLAQMRAVDREPGAFVAGVGTGGTIMGVGQHLRSEVPGVRLHPLEPANSPTLRTGSKVGSHRIQGISDEFVPAIVDLDALDDIVDVWDGDAIIMARRLAAELGLAVGISSGANFIGALKAGSALDGEPVVATVFADSNKKYLSTDLCRDEEAKAGYVSTEVEFLGCRVLPRPAP